ncbi:MAG: hypothetical protein O9333_17250 [Beijerinckiaceae bacterium]|jgi:hypothetical protein|nr:hypothetical protein [Beijerinckiaceae bacterium]
MTVIVAEIRSVYYRALMLLLFPFVFLWTALESVPRERFKGLAEGALLAFAMLSTLALGLASVYGLKILFS